MINAGQVVVYLDDILIFSEDLITLKELSSEVLRRLENFDLYLKPEKCSFAQTSIEYLGIIISEGQCHDTTDRGLTRLESSLG